MFQSDKSALFISILSEYVDLEGLVSLLLLLIRVPEENLHDLELDDLIVHLRDLLVSDRFFLEVLSEALEFLQATSESPPVLELLLEKVAEFNSLEEFCVPLLN